MALQIIVVTLDGERVDCRVQGSPLSVAGYGNVIALAIRGVARMFAENANVSEDAVAQEIMRVIESEPSAATFQAERLH